MSNSRRVVLFLGVVFAAALLADELVRGYVLLPMVKSDFLEASDLRSSAEKIETDYENILIYPDSAALRSRCNGQKFCFSFSHYPRADTVLAQLALLNAGLTDVLLTRKCSGRDCNFDEDIGAFVEPLSHERSMRIRGDFVGNDTCEEPIIYTAIIVSYRSEFCRRDLVFRGKLVWSHFYAKIEQPVYFRFLASVWFRSELDLRIDYGRRRIEFEGREISSREMRADL